MNSFVVSQNFAVSRDELAGGVRQRLALIGEIGVNEALVIAAGDKTNLLRIRLLGEREPVLAREFAHLRLIHLAQRKARAAELLLRETKKKICLVLGGIGGAAQQPAIALGIKLAARVVSRSKEVGANLPRGDQQLIELQVIVAKAARNRRASGEILLHERPHYVLLKTFFMIYDVVRNAQVFGDAASVVNILNRAAASLHLLGHTLASGKAALVPELHGQANYSVAFRAQHSRDGRRIDTARHGYGNGLCGHKCSLKK